MNNTNAANIRNYGYEELQSMREHAKKYDSENDKKTFLKQVSPIEQKMILLSSKRPYDVLVYLDELNLKSTKVMLEQLRDEEIMNLLLLFSPEDKKRFYSTFSQPFVVNRFIEFDKKAFTHISDLDLDRKVELLDSSNMTTIDATKKVYESISSNEEKLEISNNLTTASGAVAFDVVSGLDGVETNIENNSGVTDEDVDKDIQAKIDIPVLEQAETNNLENPKEEKENEEVNKNAESKEAVAAIDGEKKSYDDILNQFQQAKVAAETEHINEIQKLVQLKAPVVSEEEIVKTL